MLLKRFIVRMNANQTRWQVYDQQIAKVVWSFQYRSRAEQRACRLNKQEA